MGELYEIEATFDSFEKFKKKVEKIRKSGGFDYDDLTESEFKSKSVLGNLDDKLDRITVNDLIGALPSIVVYYNASYYPEQYWSAVVSDAKLNADDTERLIDVIDKYSAGYYYRRGDVASNISSEEKTNLVLTFALNNDRAWDKYGEFLQKEDITPTQLLYALSKTPKVKPEFLPLLHKVLGDDFTELYLKHKTLIDRTPRKHHFEEMLKAHIYKRNNFMKAFEKKAGELSSAFGGTRLYGISQALFQKEGFREAALQMGIEMLAKKERYADVTPNDGTFENIRRMFPEIAELTDKIFDDKITFEKVSDVISVCKMEKKLLHQIKADSELSQMSSRLIHTIIKAHPDNIEHVKEVVRLLNKNRVHPKVLVSLSRIDLPDWMYPVVSKAADEGVITLNRLGSRETLFDAAKAWSINPKIWKKEAEIIGRMPLEARMVAGEIFTQITQDENSLDKRDELRQEFWSEMKKAQDMGWKNAIFHYCQNNAETRGRVMTLYAPHLDEETQVALRKCVHFRDLIDFDMEKFNQTLDLWKKHLGLGKTRVLGDPDGYIVSRGDVPMLKRVVAFSKIFTDENLRDKFLSHENVNGRRDLMWIPVGMSDEKYASLGKYLQKNLFYEDGNGNSVPRPVEQLWNLAEVWPKLTPQQEEYDFGKLQGIYYTQKSCEHIEKVFQSWKQSSYFANNTRCQVADLDFSDNLRLYQKFLLALTKPTEQKDINEILLLNRKDGMRKIAELLEEQNSSDNQSENKQVLVDLIIGNDAQINGYERNQIASLKPMEILNFKPKNYKELVDEIMDAITLDTKAGEMFRKHYLEMIADNPHTTNSRVLDIRKRYQANREWITPSAIKGMMCFGNNYRRYLNKIHKYNVSVKKQLQKNNPGVAESDIINIHDALYWLPSNITEKDRDSFMGLIDKHLFYNDENGNVKHRPFADFECIAKAWANLTPENREKDYHKLLADIHSRKYVDCKYTEFATEAAICGIPETEYKRYEKIYEQGLQVPELIDSSKRFWCDSLIGKFLPRKDPRVGFFGKHTNCCQHFEGAGSSCAKSSVRDPYSQLFVVENLDGKIVAGSWVWESKVKIKDKYYKAFCFDNIEAKGDYKFDPRVMEIYKETLPYLAAMNYARITVGTGCQDAKVDEFPKAEEPVPLNKMYSGYTDASNQRLMLENPKARPVDYNEGEIYITGALMDDIPAMQAVSEACFPKGDRQLQVPDKDAQGLVLRDKGRIVGYVLWSEEEHSIYDMAVLPQYRKDKNASSFKLLNEMARRVRQMGGKWNAELRDSTSLRYMKAMAGRGLIDMKVGDLDHMMSDGTEVYKVTFSVKDNSENANSRSEASTDRGAGIGPIPPHNER